MRKNKFFMLGIITVFVAILSLTFVSSTFARYTSSVSGSDSARVAKWEIKYEGNNGNSLGSEDASGYVKQDITFDLFNTIMDTKDSAPETDVEYANGTIDGENIIAPGTKGQFTFTLTNKSEVTAIHQIVFTADEVGGNIPIQYSLTGNDDDWHDDIADLDVEIDSDKDDKVANSEIILNMNGGTKVYTVYWRWVIGDNASADEADTALGVNGTATVTVTATITFYQVD